MNVSEEMYHRVVDAVPEGIWVVDPQGRTIFSNRRMAEILGVDFESMPEQSCFGCVYPEELADAERHFGRTLGGDRRPFDFRLRRGDGSPVWVSISCMPMSDATGAPVGLLGLFSDISDRKQGEAALRESEERFRAIFNLAAVGVAQVSLTGSIELANDPFCEIVGYSREEVLGKNVQDFSHPDDLEEQLAIMARLLTGEIPAICMEKRCIRKDGTIVWSRLNKSCVRDRDGRPKHYISVLEDITQAKLAQATLRESEERFRNMADSAPVLICLSDADGITTFCNKQVMLFTGRTERQLAGEGFTDSVHPDDQERLCSTVAAAVQARRAFDIEFRLRRTDGDYRCMFMTGTPRFAGGGYLGHITITVDVTELKRRQDEVLATQKLESLGVLAAGIAHDFNNLLGGILSSAELQLAEGAEGLPVNQEELMRIRTATIRGGEIVRQLLIYCGEGTQALEPVNVSALVREMLQLLKVSISKRALLNIDLPEELPAVLANAAQLRQVVLNLITNASEALGADEGVISVTMADAWLGPHDRVPELPAGSYVRMEVSDTGCGMTEAVQSRIFDPFFTTKFAGRGLGLAAARGIIRSHGGAIHVVSAPGQGSRFEILLPCSGEPQREVRDVAESATGESAGLAGTVLVVEDEEMLRRAVSKMLRKKGFTVIEADNGKTAIELFKSCTPPADVVLLDLTLPGMSGRDVLREIRRIQPAINVVITSAYSHDWAQTTIGGQQPWHYIRKPYQLSEVTLLLRSACLDKRQLSDHTTG